MFCADDAVAKTLGLQFVAGSDFDLKKFPTDSNAALLNESAVKHMGFKEPLGQIIKDMGTGLACGRCGKRFYYQLALSSHWSQCL